ncbi:hypothetical protein CC53_gp141 [Rhizobium phage vB_RleS_L338C]|uniref:hypothetical protein n=1 Tax=Rhizobium phage vB_RleS_L338C TaxID=1414737 RepID=UPI0003D877FC|nr:hypothetical protein CC53_gp141 [Rhizobium phage vB_RleS_L338C]AHC30558.1 hypothetical protein L338C_141 [Rhizobium phage vB_RleS_L338C]QNH72155.1 hypothetical protein P11VFA_008 [Rhizobium phage P11VFA]
MKEYLFYIAEEDETKGTPVLIVSREYWEAEHAIESVHLFDDLQDRLPECISDELAESMFVSDKGRDDTKADMEAAGFIWEPALANAGQ